MRRIHVFVIALLLAAAAVAGVFAVMRTTQLGAATRAQVPVRQLAARNRRLDRIEKALLVQAQHAAHGTTAARAEAPITYVRPKPIIRVLHHGGGEHENEGESDD